MCATGSIEVRHEPKRARILIVDDYAPIRQSLHLLLDCHPDWEVCGEAVDGVEAIEKQRLLRPNLIVIDVSMPVMNGIAASREILKHFPDILILLYTSYLTQQLVEVAHDAGIRAAVSKDTMNLVTAGLEALLRGEEFWGPTN